MHNLIEAVDLSKTNLAASPLRQKLVNAASYFVTKTMLMSGFMTVTLDSFWDILEEKYKAKNAFMVPHGSFPTGERTIGAIQNLNMNLADSQKLNLIIGGSDHPAAPGYLQALAAKHRSDKNIIFHGYVAEDKVSDFFTQAKLAIFDYDSTTGSSGVLHQAAIYGTPAAYPMMGDFIDVTQREGLRGFNFKALDQSALEDAILKSLSDGLTAQSIADNNIDISKGVTLNTVASIQLQLLKKVKTRKFYKLRRAKNSALRIQQNHHAFSGQMPASSQIAT